MNMTINYEPNVHITRDEHNRLIKIEREYNALREFIINHMGSVGTKDSTIKEESNYIYEYIFNSLGVGDLLLCHDDIHTLDNTLVFQKGKYYTIKSRTANDIEIINETDDESCYDQLTIARHFSLVRQLCRPIQIGDKLVAIDPCIMKLGGNPALNVGQEYEILRVRNDKISIKSNLGSDHYFYFTDLLLYFKQT